MEDRPNFCPSASTAILTIRLSTAGSAGSERAGDGAGDMRGRTGRDGPGLQCPVFNYHERISSRPTLITSASHTELVSKKESL